MTIVVVLAAATLVVACTSLQITPLARLCLAAPQLLLLPLACLGLLALIDDIASYSSAQLDGEWFHEGWPIIESVGVWLTVPIGVFVAAGRELLRGRIK